MTSWRNQSFWSKAWTFVLLAVLLVFSDGADLTGLGDGSSKRKRVFSPGFIVLCVIVAVVELIALNHFLGER